MKKAFYPKLALTGMIKNKKLYLPFILTCIGMVMMFYIMCTMANVEFLGRESASLTMIMELGTWVIAIFSVIFLFYTNAFLMRRRKKEFGLYNVLGMDKRNISRILFWETIGIAVFSIVIGMALGILFSKLVELCLANMMDYDIDYAFAVSAVAIKRTLIIFGAVFVLLFLNALRQIHAANPIALLHSENLGEKPPKANWVLGILGFGILAAAYYLAVSIDNPLDALTWFFVAVIMVIVATYLIFVAGSVLLCKILQKNKKYYYRADHFVSVSNMAYRMKRNGAGLASICILATMVLVMISSTSCLYFGREGSLRQRYPRDASVSVSFEYTGDMTEERISALRGCVEDAAEGRQTDVMDYRCFDISGMLAGGKINPNVDGYNSVDTLDGLIDVNVMYLSDYNRMMGTSHTLKDDEAIIYWNRSPYEYDTIQIADGPVIKVIPGEEDYSFDGNAIASVVDTVCIVVNDVDTVSVPLYEAAEEMNEKGGEYYIPEASWNYFFNLPDASDEEQDELCESVGNALSRYLMDADYDYVGYSYGCIAAERADFYGFYGGLFFLGIMLSIVFICATVLIIYYKQISEGYEDQARFEIMQKVGMTKKDIRHSINSQMLTVFALPIVFGAIHFAFSFPLIYKLLQLFAVTDIKLLVITAGITVFAFAVIYTVIYRVTSNAYYNIVSGAKE
ncbi:MAG: ABC transporter permease [Bacillota bacterium]|nr:ABC transporter permease [Bacillota bacterium]